MSGGMWAGVISKRVLNRERALIPVFAICSGAVVMCATYIGYMCKSKGDLSFRPWSWKSTAPYNTNLDRTQRMIGYNAPIPGIPKDIEELRRELGSAQL